MLQNLIFILKSIIMGIVEGITEFLPISSTGHLILTGHIIGFTQPDKFVNMFEVVIQLGAILAIVVLYWDKIFNSLKHLKISDWGFKLWSTIIVAFLPSMVLGFTLKKYIDKYLMDNVLAVALAMVVGGLLLFFIENKYRKNAYIKDMDRVNYKQAFFIGCFQCLAMWPGMSRSASTIMGAWIAGLSSFAAAEFSFFLALPTMAGASFLDLIKYNWNTVSAVEIISLAVGFLASFIVALYVVEKFINFLKKKPMRVFSIYRIAMGFIILILVISKVLI